MRIQCCLLVLAVLITVAFAGDPSAQATGDARLTRTITVISTAGARALVDACSAWAERNKLTVAMAMGLQASSLTHFGGTAVSTVVVTSTLARIADAALDRVWPIAPRHTPPSTAPSRLLAITWIGYLGGAMAGTALLAVMPWPLLVPAALLVIVVATLPAPRLFQRSRGGDNRNPN